jgi:hypothetical protein
MTTMTQLFKMVEANDYEGLSRLIQSKKKVDLNVVKSHQTLLAKAIEVRSRECFDIILEWPDYKFFNVNSSLSGLNQIIDYYLVAPNPSNEYYLNRLLDKNVQIGTSIYKCINHPDIFNRMLFKLVVQPEFTKNIILGIIQVAIENANFNIFLQMMENLDNKMVDSTQTEKMEIYKNIITYGIKAQNIQIVDYIINNKNISVKNIIIQNQPILYYCFDLRNNLMFNYFHMLYLKLSEQELNEIPGIKYFSLTTKYREKINFESIKEYFDKIMQLNIQWDSYEKIIKQLFGKIFNSQTSYSIRYLNVQFTSDVQQIFKLMFYCYKTGQIKSNPFVHFVLDCGNNYNGYSNIFDSIVKLNNTNISEQLKSFLRGVIYMGKHFNWEAPDTVKNLFNKAFTKEQLDTMMVDKDNFVKSIEQSFEVQVKAKKSRTIKKKQPEEIDV